MIALTEKRFLESSEREGFLDEADRSHEKQLDDLDRVFSMVAEADTPTEVLSDLCFYTPFYSRTSIRVTNGFFCTKYVGARLFML